MRHAIEVPSQLIKTKFKKGDEVYVVSKNGEMYGIIKTIIKKICLHNLSLKNNNDDTFKLLYDTYYRTKLQSGILEKNIYFSVDDIMISLKDTFLKDTNCLYLYFETQEFLVLAKDSENSKDTLKIEDIEKAICELKIIDDET